MTRTAVVLLSGGLDSATVLAIARSEGFEIVALSFRYGQRHQAEIAAAQEIAKRAGAYVCEVNPERTPLSDLCDELLMGKAGEVLPLIGQ